MILNLNLNFKKLYNYIIFIKIYLDNLMDYRKEALNKLNKIIKNKSISKKLKKIFIMRQLKIN